MVGRLTQIKLEMNRPEMRKFKRYLNSFWTLTKDEQANVLSKHKRFNKYIDLLSEEMSIMSKQLMKALEAGPSNLTHGAALQIEPLDLSKITFVGFNTKNLKLPVI